MDAAGATDIANETTHENDVHGTTHENDVVLGTEAWAEALTKLYGPVSASAVQRQRFRAMLRARELGPVRVSAVHCPAAELRDAGPCDGRAARYHLALVLVGELALEQAGRTAWARSGGLVLLDTGRQFRMRLVAPWNTVVTAHLSRSLPDLAPDVLGRLTARELPGREQLAAMAAGFLARLARDTTPYRPCDEVRLGAMVTELVRMLTDHGLGDEARAPAGHALVMLRRIQGYVLHHLGDSRLTPDRVAAAHHISTRYLHRLFQRQGLTVAAWIKAQRLERCRRDLTDPRLRHLPVHVIAARWGFDRAADFSRAFRVAYGVTPTGLRAGDCEPTAGVRSLTRNSAVNANDEHSSPQHTHR
ncbi:helix-turn-helix domain-containing protein [Streptomyces sp. KM273126]|uniref:helix-turn-helix domain-containing protein n=1 Tax=Streptomyces sp. KM273126 TaxID=2545247 RepID=UPI0014046B4B|nr:helix-turn-helix domain-containing protein [Streptomyces sp. KM273126]MBA2807870.1 helix-turn-helix domain-containing protein [Streptomyces sp. KM273126]